MFPTKNQNSNRARIQLQEQVNLTSRRVPEVAYEGKSVENCSCTFRPHKSKCITSPITMNGPKIPWSIQVKYLRITIGRNLNFGTLVSNIPYSSVMISVSFLFKSENSLMTSKMALSLTSFPTRSRRYDGLDIMGIY